MRIVGQLTPDEFWCRVESGEEQVRAGAGSLPTYGLEGWDGPIMIGDWEWDDKELILASLAHGTPDTNSAVEVVTTVHDPQRQAVRSMERAIGLTPIDADYARRHRAIQDVPGSEIQIRVNGRPTTFTTWGGRERWWAAGTVDGRGVVLEGRRHPLEQVDLVRVDDVEPYLAGRREYLRECRGE
ncbi:hypothetical protein [Rhodococcus wratislaviensis]|uniref:hypothetical protein n=1 Tax=Rhodococcus wratislaviensis TaxID=44752 RepID=UPI00365CDD70